MGRVVDFTTAAEETEGIVDRLTTAAIASAGLNSRDEAQDVIDEVLRLAEEWRGGRLPLAEIRRLTTPQERFLAARFVRPQPAALKGLLDALIDETESPTGGFAYRTKHGLMTTEELAGPLVEMARVDGGIRIRLAQRWRWLRRPKPDGKTEEERQGERAAPVFPATAEERRAIANERDDAKREPSMRERWSLTT